jgi:N-acetyl-gamma-glutamyl-phosphate reductase
MIVEVPLHLHVLPGRPGLEDIHRALARAYQGEQFVQVAPLVESLAMSSVAPEGLNGTNLMRLMVFGSAENGQARLVALLDNLGKGAGGAAVQNLNLMLGLGEATNL